MENKNEIIYLESGEDIASLASKIKRAQSNAVSFVVPRGGSVAQSVVNLKLLKREAEKAGKSVSLVTKDTISKNLASQVGITVYRTTDEAKKAEVSFSPDINDVALNEAEMRSGIHINRYEKDEDDEFPEEGEKDKTEQDDKLRSELNEVLKSEQKPDKVETKKIIGRTESDPKRASDKNLKKVDPKMFAKNKKIGSRKKPLIIISSLFLLVALSLTYVFLPRADLSIVMATSDIGKEYEITIDRTIDEVNQKELSVPGEEITVSDELTKEFQSSGKKIVGNKASGEITFYNYDYQSSDPKVLAKGTVLVASKLNFIVLDTVTIPGASATIVQGSVKVTPSTVKGRIEAQNPGEEYNIDASNFEIQGLVGADKENVYGQSSANLSGGTSEEKIVVSEDDLKRAESELKTELSGKILEQITSDADKKELKVLASSFSEQPMPLESDRKKDEEALKFNAKLVVKTTALAFSENDFRGIVVAFVEEDLDDNQMLVNPEKNDLNYELVSYDSEKGVMKLKGKFDGKFGRKISDGEIIKKAKNQKIGSAKTKLKNIDGVLDATIKVWPSFMTRISFLESRININFDYRED